MKANDKDKLFDTFKNENLHKRKLKAIWTVDARQDLHSQHNLDVESELTKILAEELFQNIQRKKIEHLFNNRQN